MDLGRVKSGTSSSSEGPGAVVRGPATQARSMTPTAELLQLFSLPLEVLGVLLAMIEVFSPRRAQRVTQRLLP